MKKVLVTGGAGFIGSHVVDNLLERGITPVIFDHKNNEQASNSPADGRCQYFFGDIKSFTDVSEAIALCDGVIHLAGVLGTQETINEPKPAVETNIIGGLNVFQAVKNYKIPAVYIAVGNHFENNSYSISKTTVERFAFMFNKEHGTKIAVVRGLNAYGPRQKEKPVRKIMPNFVLPALRNETITIYGDGNQVMDMIYVTDLADILVRALVVNHGVYDRVFEAGTGVETTVNDIAYEVTKQIFREKVNMGLIFHAPMRPGETPGVKVLGNPETLIPLYHDQIDIHPKYILTDLKEGVKKTIEYYKNYV